LILETRMSACLCVIVTRQKKSNADIEKKQRNATGMQNKIKAQEISQILKLIDMP
jgi:hypothetical protein